MAWTLCSIDIGAMRVRHDAPAANPWTQNWDGNGTARCCLNQGRPGGRSTLEPICETHLARRRHRAISMAPSRRPSVPTHPTRLTTVSKHLQTLIMSPLIGPSYSRALPLGEHDIVFSLACCGFSVCPTAFNPRHPRSCSLNDIFPGQ